MSRVVFYVYAQLQWEENNHSPSVVQHCCNLPFAHQKQRWELSGAVPTGRGLHRTLLPGLWMWKSGGEPCSQACLPNTSLLCAKALFAQPRIL